MPDTNGTRTHEPSLREVTSDLDGLKALFLAKLDAIEKVMNERDRRYDERFEATDEKTSLALAGSKEAVTKAETATEKRFDSVNEFRGSLKDQAATLLPREEANAKFKAYEDKLDDVKKELADLKEYRSESGGKEKAQAGSLLQRNWSIEVLVAVLLGAAGLLVNIFRH